MLDGIRITSKDIVIEWLKQYDIPNSIETYIVNHISRNHHYIDTTSDYNCYRILNNALESVLQTKIFELEKKAALCNPIEFMRYHSIVTDTRFAALFPANIDQNERNMIIDILETIIKIREKLNN